MSSWSPDQYERFRAERRQPFDDLVRLIEPRSSMRIVDLGCGTGELTRELHDRLHAAETTGIDNSASMLSRSNAFATDGLHFENADITTFVSEGTWDLVFSNAALHWIPGHAALFRRLTDSLAAGGQLAVQMPVNDDHPSHVLAAELAVEFGVEAKPTHTLPVEQYAALLHELGYRRPDVRMQVYGHLLPSSADVVEWVKGTLLTDYQRRLDPERYEEFLASYRERVIAEFPKTRPYFYTYKRILLHGSLDVRP